MEKLTLDKNDIVIYLKEFLENHYDIELEDILFYNMEKRTSFFLCYSIIYHGNKEKVFKPLMTEEFITLLRTAIKEKKAFVKPYISITTEGDLKCKVNYHLTDGYGRRRRK